MATTTTRLDVKSRIARGSRAARRLRRENRVPGVLYGGDSRPIGFDADARELRIGETIALASIVMPEGVTLLDETEDVIVATLSPPRLQMEAEAEEEELEAETELVGEEAEGEAAEGDEEPAAEGGESSEE